MKLLLPVRGWNAESDAIDIACEMVKGTKGMVYATYVIEVPRNLPLDSEITTEVAEGERVLNEVEKAIKKRRCPVKAQLLQARRAGPALVQEATEKSLGAIVLALPYMKKWGNFTLGDTVPYILKNAPCRVLLCRDHMNGNLMSGMGS